MAFLTFGKSANNNAVLVAATFQLYNESIQSWNNAFKFLKSSHPDIDPSEKTLLMDGQKGAARAFEETFSNVGVFICSNHRADNFVSNFGKVGHKMKKFHQDIVLANNQEDYDSAVGTAKGNLSEPQYKKLMELPAACQFLFQAQRRHGDSGADMLGCHTTQLVESMNQALKHIRGCPLFEAVIGLVNSERARFVNNQNEVARGVRNDDVLTQHGKRILDSLKQAHRKYAGTAEVLTLNSNRATVGVSDDSQTRTVTFHDMHCSCGKPEVTGEPCLHVYIAAQAGNYSADQLFRHRDFHVSSWKEQYPLQVSFETVELQEVKKMTDYMLPVVTPNQTGRPPNNKRIRSAVEQAMRNTVRCSRCGRKGHNRRSKSCPKRQDVDDG